MAVRYLRRLDSLSQGQKLVLRVDPLAKGEFSGPITKGGSAKAHTQIRGAKWVRNFGRAGAQAAEHLG